MGEVHFDTGYRSLDVEFLYAPYCIVVASKTDPKVLACCLPGNAHADQADKPETLTVFTLLRVVAMPVLCLVGFFGNLFSSTNYRDAVVLSEKAGAGGWVVLVIMYCYFLGLICYYQIKLKSQGAIVFDSL